MRAQFVAGSLAAHAVALGVLGWTATPEGPRDPELIVIDVKPLPPVVEPAPAPPAPPAHETVAPEPPKPKLARRVVAEPIPEPPALEPPAPATPEPPAPPAPSQGPIEPAPASGPGLFAVARAGLWSSGATTGVAGGRGLGRPGRQVIDPVTVQRIDQDLRRMDASRVRLQYLMRSWQHNEYVGACLRESVSRGGSAVQNGTAARARLYGALTREDRDGAQLELARFRKSAVDFDAIYQSARRCLERSED